MRRDDALPAAAVAPAADTVWAALRERMGW